MCGILAVLGVGDVSLAKRSRIIKLSHRLQHRGPDWSGIHSFEDCYLAYQRLAIVDPTSGDQPLYNEDKTVVVTVNGEIYNHELKAKLTSHKFQTGSDCEVIAHLCVMQPQGTNLYGFYVCEFMRTEVTEDVSEFWQNEALRSKLAPEDRFAPIQDELAGFILEQIINENGKYYWRDLAGEFGGM